MIFHFLICILLLLLLILILYFYFLIKIDIVYTWVDDTILDKNIASAQLKNNNEILYSLRSVCKYAKWFNHIFLIVSDTQKLPNWLDTTKIFIIRHSQIIPKKYLPTFNSIAIESFIHYIPNLSEYYIYFNDDMILLNQTFISDFFDFFHKPIETKCHSIQSAVSFNDINNYSFENMMLFNNLLLNKYFKKESNRYQSQHIPSSNKKSFQFELDKFLNNIYINNTNIHDFSKKSKYRQNMNIARYSLFKKYWNIYKYKCKEKRFEMNFIEISHLKSKKDDILKITNSKNKFLCVQNNIAYGDINESIGIKDFESLLIILQTKFPHKCKFEI